MTRADRPVRLLCVGAHPDDCEFQASGLAALVARSGGTVRLMSMTDGACGHHEQSGSPLVERRLEEGRAGAAAVGAEAVNLGLEDGWLMPTREVREEVIRQIRSFAPDVVVCPRAVDYHPDHRATGTVVQDAGYLLMVPHVVPEVPVPSVRPVILHMSDPFSRPVPFRPDLVVDIGPVLEAKIEAIMAHRSQVYEWLPVINGFAAQVPPREPDRTDFLRRREISRLWAEAEAFAEPLRRRYGRVVEYAEAYEISAYGRHADAEELYALLGV